MVFNDLAVLLRKQLLPRLESISGAVENLLRFHTVKRPFRDFWVCGVAKSAHFKDQTFLLSRQAFVAVGVYEAALFGARLLVGELVVL